MGIWKLTQIEMGEVYVVTEEVENKLTPLFVTYTNLSKRQFATICAIYMQKL